MLKVTLTLMLLLLGGCFPLSEASIKAIMENLKDDSASACLITGLSGGGGGAVMGPGMIPAGGWGEGKFLFCRSNEPGSYIEVHPDGSIVIEHGE